MPVERYASEYNMKHVRRGMAIIFNHEHFDIQSLKSRTGTNVDCENLKNTLERLSFDVTVHRDKRYNDIMSIVDTCKCAISCISILCVYFPFSKLCYAWHYTSLEKNYFLLFEWN